MGLSSYGEQERRILEHHVTNLDGNVYAVFNLPPEVTAVVFAYVSRSPASFRDNLLKLVLSGDLDMSDMLDLYNTRPVDLTAAREKAREFHERITVGYGHSSVAELANLAIGCERISRLASAELELANRWLSFSEFSQRYQRPQRGGYVVPPELSAIGDATLIDLFKRTQDSTFDAYEQLFTGLQSYLLKTIPPEPGETERRHRLRVEKIAFEDARYALTLAVHTSLGVTGNARAFRDAIVRLLSDPYAETTELATAIRQEGRKICPALIRYADPNDYQQTAWRALADPPPSSSQLRTRFVRLLDWTGRQADHPAEANGRHGQQMGYHQIAGDVSRYLQPYKPAPVTPDESAALQRVLAAAWTAHGRFVSETELAAVDGTTLLEAYERLMHALGPHDHPVDALKQASYLFEISVSEANWHQLLRHCRQIDFAPERPTIKAGITIPPHIEQAGLSDVLLRAVAQAEAAYEQISSAAPTAAHYLVTNAHNRRTLARVSLWEMFHLINLRGKPDAQWDIRQTVLAMREVVRSVHPHLLEVERSPKLAVHGPAQNTPG